MTRINLIPVSELSDQHLIAEYRELPRIIKQKINIKDAPARYCLGKGHVKWARKHSIFCLVRYEQLCEEMKYRGFKVNFSFEDLKNFWIDDTINNYDTYHLYFKEPEEVELSRDRIKEKIKQKKDWYKWTNREKPEYVC